MTDSDTWEGTWKALPGARHVLVCDVGGWVQTLPRDVNGRRYPGGLLTPAMTGTSRYWQVQYTDDRGVRRKRPVHLLVLEAHDRLRPPGREGCHNDGNLHNNDLANLRWDWPDANRLDRFGTAACEACGGTGRVPVTVRDPSPGWVWLRRVTRRRASGRGDGA